MVSLLTSWGMLSKRHLIKSHLRTRFTCQRFWGWIRRRSRIAWALFLLLIMTLRTSAWVWDMIMRDKQAALTEISLMDKLSWMKCPISRVFPATPSTMSFLSWGCLGSTILLYPRKLIGIKHLSIVSGIIFQWIRIRLKPGEVYGLSTSRDLMLGKSGTESVNWSTRRWATLVLEFKDRKFLYWTGPGRMKQTTLGKMSPKGINWDPRYLWKNGIHS